MQIFYAPNIDGSIYTLNEEESKHCIRVLRLTKGDSITLVDGNGNLFETIIENPDVKKCQVKVIETYSEFEKRSFYLHIAIAPTKNIERFEWFLEKATEIGIDEITPILCEHSERKVINPERLEKIIISAMKQSIKAYLPKLNPLTTLSDFIASTGQNQTFIAHCQTKNLPHLKNMISGSSSYTVLIGPEGDFSPNEITQSTTKGIKEVSLGSSRLRTETAGIVACNVVNLIFEL